MGGGNVMNPQFFVGDKVIDGDGFKGTITDYYDIANMFYVSHEVVDGQKQGWDGWFSPEKLKRDVPVMTKNEYQEFLNRNAERLHTDASYSLYDYNRDADSVQVLGFDLDKFDLTDNEREVIDRMFESDSISKLGNVCLRGHLLYRELVNAVANTLDCNVVCDKGHNGFYKNDDKRCVLEFCEGDITLILCETDKAYQAELDSYCQFYEIERAASGRKGSLDGLINSAEEVAQAVSSKAEGKAHKDMGGLGL